MKKSASELVQELREQAEAIIGQPTGQVDEFLDALARYSACFADLQEVSGLDSLDESELRDLNTVHSEVLAIAKALEPRLSEDMAGLRKKGKALMGYLDILPRRISSRRPRKG
ncbi:MAG: hypothetical protein KDD70_05390 [Bdellovibrionales bacterium]|nr:hypothetical protein [Bdellovibrionales bacterium]